MEEELKKATQKQKKKGPKLIVFIVVSILIILLTGMQVFATFNGYGNVFFLIKSLISPTVVTSKDEILTDKDITISYQFIEVANGIEVQVNNLEMKEDESTLCLTVKAENDDLLPLSYSLKGEGLNETELESSNRTEKGEFRERLTVKHRFYGTELMTLYIKDKDGKLLRELEISLNDRQIAVSGAKEVEKISEVELKKYLNVFSILNNKSKDQNDLLLDIADLINSEIRSSINKPSKDQYNQILSEFYGENIDLNDEGILELDGSDWNYDSKVDTYVKTSSDYEKVLCLSVEDITYSNEIYDVDYIYVIIPNNDVNIEELPQYEGNIKLSINNNFKYSKYNVKSVSVKEIQFLDITNTISNTTNNVSYNTIRNTTNSVSNTVRNTTNSVYNTVKNTTNSTSNTVSNTTNTVNDGHTHTWVVIRRSGNESYNATLDGTHEIICTTCGERKREPHNFGTWYTLYDATAWSLWCNDCGRYIYTNDYAFVQSSGHSYEDREQYLVATVAQEQLKKFYKVYLSLRNGTYEDICEVLGFNAAEMLPANPKVEKFGYISFNETNIDYNEFKARMLNIITERLFQEKFLPEEVNSETPLIRNVNGKLYINASVQGQGNRPKQYYNPSATKMISEGKYHSTVTMIGDEYGTFELDFYTVKSNGIELIDRLEKM